MTHPGAIPCAPSSFDESANIYAKDRERSLACLRGQAPGVANPPDGVVCNPRVFRQRVNIASRDGYKDASLRRTLAPDPGVNAIAGILTNRMSAKGCETVMANTELYSSDYNPNGYSPTEDLCDVESLMVAASLMSPG